MKIDDDAVIILGCVALLGAAWWYFNKEGEFDIHDLGLTGETFDLGEAVNTIQNALWMAPAAAAPYLPAIAAAESKYGLPNNLLARLLYQESRFRDDIITGKTKSPAGAVGIAQFMPATAKQYGINPLDPFQSINAAGLMLKQLYAKYGNWSQALAGYNWGQGNVDKKGLAAAPAETKSYFNQILGDLGLA